PHELVLRGRLADDAGLEDRAFAMRDRVEMENRERGRVRVVSEVVAEWSLRAALPGPSDALEQDPRVGGDPHRERARAREPRRRSAQEAGEGELVDAFGQRRDAREQRRGIGAHGAGDVEVASELLGAVVVDPAALADLPVHAGRLRVVDVHAVDAEVARVRLRVLGEHETERDEAPAVAGPQLEDRQRPEGRTARAPPAPTAPAE